MSIEPSGRTDTIELPPPWLRIGISIALAGTLLVAPLLVVFSLYQNGKLAVLTEQHAAAMIGVPWAGGAAFVVVLVLRASFGAMEFSFLGFTFKGASGPIVLWVLCFLAEILAIKTLW